MNCSVRTTRRYEINRSLANYYLSRLRANVYEVPGRELLRCLAVRVAALVRDGKGSARQRRRISKSAPCRRRCRCLGANKGIRPARALVARICGLGGLLAPETGRSSVVGLVAGVPMRDDPPPRWPPPRPLPASP